MMNGKQETNFIWCPVCMVHTYHKRSGGKWVCLNEDHPVFLRLRDDPWIEEYRKAQAARQVTVAEAR